VEGCADGKNFSTTSAKETQNSAAARPGSIPEQRGPRLATGRVVGLQPLGG
jgi:hypothetical protein